MQTINIVNLMGHIGSEIQVAKVGANNISRASVQLATNIGTGEKQRTQWHTAVFWGEYADVVSQFKKGDALYVSGILEYRKWKDAESGADRERTEITVSQFSKVDNPLSTVNQINLLGHVGSDAQFKIFNDNARTILSVATNSGYGENQRVQWHSVIFWGKSAEIVSNLKKGDIIFINGLIDYRKWQDAQTGENRIRTEIQMQQFSIVKGEICKPQLGQASNQQGQAPKQPPKQQSPEQQPPQQGGGYAQFSNNPQGYNNHGMEQDQPFDLPY